MYFFPVAVKDQQNIIIKAHLTENSSYFTFSMGFLKSDSTVLVSAK